EEGALIGLRAGQPYRILDEEAVLAFFWAHRADDAPALTHAFLSQEAFWERDLTLVPGLEAYVAEALADIRALGVRRALEKRFA
ncbi:MAG: tagaturonate reductase, partial [Eubacteriales bacterium]|nr:tagaturonate reductase [Eubacteriales bacterium]